MVIFAKSPLKGAEIDLERDKAETKGKPIPVIDGLIAATGMTRDMTVATRNVDDMPDGGVRRVNPWNGGEM